MSARWVVLLVLAAVGLGLVAGRVTAGGHEDQPGGMPPMPKPGAEHAEIAKSAGDWAAEMTYWTPGGPVKASDTETSKVVMKGWFLQSDYNGSQGMDGKPWKGRSIVGYDQRAKEYVTIWYSEMDSSISVYRGKKCPKNIIHLHGEGWNPMKQAKAPIIMQVHPHAEDGSHKMEMYWADENKKPGQKMMQIVYTKKK